MVDLVTYGAGFMSFHLRETLLFPGSRLRGSSPQKIHKKIRRDYFFLKVFFKKLRYVGKIIERIFPGVRQTGVAGPAVTQ